MYYVLHWRRSGYRILFAAKVDKRVTDVGVKGGTVDEGGLEGGRDAGTRQGLVEFGRDVMLVVRERSESLGQNGGRKRDQRSE